MKEFIDKLEVLKEYLFIKIDWDSAWPLMTFDTYLSYRQDEPNVAHWLRVLNAQVKQENKKAEKIIQHFGQTGMLLAQSNNQLARQMAAISFGDIRRHYFNQGVVNSQNRNRMGLLGSPYGTFEQIFGLRMFP